MGRIRLGTGPGWDPDILTARLERWTGSGQLVDISADLDV